MLRLMSTGAKPQLGMGDAASRAHGSVTPSIRCSNVISCQQGRDRGKATARLPSQLTCDAHAVSSLHPATVWALWGNLRGAMAAARADDTSARTSTATKGGDDAGAEPLLASVRQARRRRSCPLSAGSVATAVLSLMVLALALLPDGSSGNALAEQQEADNEATAALAACLAGMSPPARHYVMSLSAEGLAATIKTAAAIEHAATRAACTASNDTGTTILRDGPESLVLSRSGVSAG